MNSHTQTFLFFIFSITVFPLRILWTLTAQFRPATYCFTRRGSLCRSKEHGHNVRNVRDVLRGVINIVRRWQNNPYPLPPRGRRPDRWTRGNSSNGDVGTGAGTRADLARRLRPPPASREVLFCTARADFSPIRGCDCRQPRRPPLLRLPWNKERSVVRNING